MANVTQQKHLTAAVTGAGSGLGRDIALALAAKNYRVFGTALSPQEIDDLKQASDGAVSLSQCDISDEAAVRNWVREVVAQTGGGLDLLISNAGVLTPGPLEVLPLSAIRREFEVNVFGVLAVVNAFLPALRKQRGRIVQVSAWTASLPLPFNGQEYSYFAGNQWREPQLPRSQSRAESRGSLSCARAWGPSIPKYERPPPTVECPSAHARCIIPVLVLTTTEATN
jgi:NAD(P)-dependent dehydrogenase (short-subunit alcohol dehydrogenase family)